MREGGGVLQLDKYRSGLYSPNVRTSPPRHCFYCYISQDSYIYLPWRQQILFAPYSSLKRQRTSYPEELHNCFSSGGFSPSIFSSAVFDPVGVLGIQDHVLMCTHIIVSKRMCVVCAFGEYN